MQDTVDQAHSAVPRTLAGIIQDAFRPCVVTAAPTAPAWACSFSGTGPDGLTWLVRWPRTFTGSTDTARCMLAHSIL